MASQLSTSVCAIAKDFFGGRYKRNSDDSTLCINNSELALKDVTD